MLCSLLLCPCIQAQQQAIKNLVFEGAGIRGIAYCGAIRELEDKGLMTGIERVGGTSAGAITALTLSLGYSGQEIATIITETNFKKFNDGRFFFAGGINRLQKYFGWYRGERFTRWLEQMIASKTGNADITFEELHQQGFKDLYVTATCLNEQRLVILSRETYPNMRVKDAVRISMSIPFYFEAVFIDTMGNVVKHPKKKNNLDVMVDGGFTGNFPIKIFDSSRYMAVVSSSNNFMINPATLGFRIDRAEQITSDSAGGSLAPMTVGNLREYAGAFYNIIIENLNRQTLSADDWKRTVSISDGKIGPKIRKLSKAEIEMLMENGRVAAKKHFSPNQP
ncbi:MAG TPA: patatin-like phospholipase family protein [Chitinophagaceae bacterium]|nr:patatin-like phospholipase family protein [Chitinophagaceae bacterium]